MKITYSIEIVFKTDSFMKFNFSSSANRPVIRKTPPHETKKRIFNL